MKHLSIITLLSLTLTACGSGSSNGPDNTHTTGQTSDNNAPENQNQSSNPGNAESAANINQSLEIEARDDVVATAVVVRGRRYQYDQAPIQDWYDAVLSGNASWSTHARPNGCEILEDDPTGNTLRCMNPFDNTYSGLSVEGSDQIFFHPLFIDTPIDAEILVDIAYGATETDRTPSDNFASVSISHVENPTAAFGIDAPIAILSHPDESVMLSILLTQPANAYPRDAQLIIDLPDQMAATSAQVARETNVSEETYAPIDCNFGVAVICDVSNIKPDINYQVELHLLASAQSTDPIRLSFANVNPDAGDPVARRDIHVEHVRSMLVIQAILDNAEAGSTVVLPPGVFGGALDGHGKRLNVNGAAGDEPTVLLAGIEAPLLVGAGPRTTWSGLEMRSFGAPIIGLVGANFTLANSVIEPALPDIHSLPDGLVAPHNPTSLRLLNNTIHHWGSTESGTCHRLLEVTMHRAALYLQHNLFENNVCDILIESTLLPGDFSNDRDNVWLYATNNTFVDNPKLIRLAGDPETWRTLVFRNNIVTGTDVLLDISDELLDDEEQRPWLLTSNNLLWKNGAETMLNARQATLPRVFVELPDLHADPHFIDPANSDYRLAAFSPALDAGTFPGEYRWLKEAIFCISSRPINCAGFYDEPEFSETDYPQPGPEAVIQPVDGNGDGTAEYDIGAFEYRP
ncbi:hypothetical protein [Granulosicoccus antarcticus]|uniref:Uncharacterized protein n=1 Tax=Granulosicoccus antarcticus IMCC3135 TaxID=1192854 RepID=A0A2Z2NYU4_9GAMM|nr:hypothetical protein [Granulosicoccus antarcticus]ASJ72947.1 hypothetical protein IMCC3135_14310 [Granulosicoccus antarcticus IMCC3135]